MLRASLKAICCDGAVSVVATGGCREAGIRSVKNWVRNHRQHLWRGLSAGKFAALNSQRGCGR